MNEKITEQFIVDKIIEFMINKENGNWHEEKVKKSELHQHGVDIKLVGGKRNSEYFYIECKGKSYAKSAKSINREGWLNALGQIITRMDVKRYSMSKTDGKISGINHAYKYGLGLYWESAQVALRYLLEQNIVVIPKTVNKDRMVENINVFDFKLSDDDMAEILKLDTDTTLFGNHTDYDFVKYLLSIK